MTNNAFIAFLIEIWQRLSSKSPKFFVIWQWITGVLTALTGLPAVLDAVFSAFHWAPPAVFTNLENHTMTIITGLMWFIAKLPVQPSTAASGKLKYSARMDPHNGVGLVRSKPYYPPKL